MNMAQEGLKMKQCARSLVWLRKATEKDSACELDAKWRKTDPGGTGTVGYGRHPAGTGTVRYGPRRTV